MKFTDLTSPGNPAGSFPNLSLLLGLLICSASSTISAKEDDAISSSRPTRHIKQSESLAQAIDAVRYGIWPIKDEPEAAWSQNPKHGFSSRFEKNGLHLAVRTQESKVFSTRWELRELGYGNHRTAVPEGQVEHDGQRAEIVRPKIGLTEWFVNSPDGLEHGFTLSKRPGNPVESDKPLTLTLTISGDLDACSQPNGQSLHLTDALHGSTILTYDKLKVWDADERPLVARMSTGHNQVILEVDDTEARYPITIDPVFTQQTYLKSSNHDAGDYFGYAVALSGDTAVVGALREAGDPASTTEAPNNNAPVAGAAYVFIRTGEGWTQQAYLKASNCEQNDAFGISVAIDGDTIVVGAYGESGDASSTIGSDNNGASNAGAAYVFTRSGDTWTQQAYLKASNAEAEDRFGYSVAVSGDTAAVGAPNESGDAFSTVGSPNNNESRAGATYIFIRDTMGNWSQQAYLKASNAEGNDNFGQSVGLSGDTSIVGAYREQGDALSSSTTPNNDAYDAGAAYIFTRDTMDNWSQQAYLKAANAGVGDQFGWSVAVSGDTAAIGAPQESGDAASTSAAPNNNASQAGAGYIFTRTDATWTQQDYLKASNAEGSDKFGYGISVDGDTAIVGSIAESGDPSSTAASPNNDAPDAGAAYVFTRSGVTWSQQRYLKASNAGASDEFGWSVAVSGNTALVGAYGEAGDVTSTAAAPNDDASYAGSAYLFESSAALIPQAAAPDPIAVLKRALSAKIKKLKKSIKRTKKSGKNRKAKKLKKKLKKLTQRLKAL